MTNDSNIQNILTQLAQSQLRTQESLERTQNQIESIASNVDSTQLQVADTQRQLLATQNEVERIINSVESVFARNEVLNDVLLQLRDNQEVLQDNQRSALAAIDQLTAILIRLTRDDN